MKKVAISCLFVLFAYQGIAQTTIPCSSMSLGPLGALNGFVPSPQDAWHQDISNAPVDPTSSLITLIPNNLGGSRVHPDFSSIVGGNFGIPYAVVDSGVTPSVPVSMLVYPDDSDITLYPLTPQQPIEASPSECSPVTSDQHAIVIDRNKCVAYEVWQASYCKGAWTAANGAIWDLSKTEQRPYGLTSADAAGLSVFEGLLRYDEIVAGSINHALRFTANHTKDNANNGYFVAPATHASGSLWGTDNIMGMRLRLKANFDISHFSQTNQVILRALKQYGMILADNGSNLYFQGTPDARWNDDDLLRLTSIFASDFEVVQMAPRYDSETAPTGAAPAITGFTASSAQVKPGGSVTLTPTVSNATYSYIDKVGFTRGPVTVTPAETTTYTMTSRNLFGSSTASVKVVVSAGPPPPPTIKSITITPASSAGRVFVFTATAKMSDNSTQNITQTAVWETSKPAIATVFVGKLLFRQTGAVTVTAQAGSVTSNAVMVASQ